jgi:hypothetical protein
MKPSEVVLTVVTCAVFGVATLGMTNCAVAMEPDDYLGTVTTYMQVPEPIDLIFWQAPFQEFGVFLPMTATIHYNKFDGHWKMVVNEGWWLEASYHSRLSTLGHEVCHAAYDHDILMPDLWWQVSDDVIDHRQKRAKVCSSTILRRIQRGY